MQYEITYAYNWFTSEVIICTTWSPRPRKLGSRELIQENLIQRNDFRISIKHHEQQLNSWNVIIQTKQWSRNLKCKESMTKTSEQKLILQCKNQGKIFQASIHSNH